jgi:hypothetical protein
MADENRNHDWSSDERDTLDRELDAALAKYAAVDPRPGIEDRVLANLCAEREHAAARVWWRWPALAVVAAALAVAVVALMVKTEMGRPNRSAPETTAQRPPTTPPGDQAIEVRSATNEIGSPAHPTASTAAKKPSRRRVSHAQEFIAYGPRLDHFPSLRPLSQEEKLLVRYVQDFPQEAVMIAKAQQEFEIEVERLKESENPGRKPGSTADQQ